MGIATKASWTINAGSIAVVVLLAVLSSGCIAWPTPTKATSERVCVTITHYYSNSCAACVRQAPYFRIVCNELVSSNCMVMVRENNIDTQAGMDSFRNTGEMTIPLYFACVTKGSVTVFRMCKSVEELSSFLDRNVYRNLP